MILDAKRSMKTCTLILAVSLALALAIAPSAVHAQTVRSAEMEVQFHRALIAWESGNSLYEAKARIDRVLSVEPEDLAARKLRAAILMGLGRNEEAIDDALFAVQLQPRDGEAQLLLCESAMINTNADLARKALSSASDLIVDDLQLLSRLSMCALSLGDIPRAESLARIAVAQNELDPRGHIQLARVFLRSERPAAAISVLDKMISRSILSPSAIRNDPEFAAVYPDK